MINFVASLWVFVQPPVQRFRPRAIRLSPPAGLPRFESLSFTLVESCALHGFLKEVAASSGNGSTRLDVSDAPAF